jgi:AcrR family transcriptional regulator
MCFNGLTTLAERTAKMKKYDSSNRTKKSLETKEKIFCTALKLFNHHGYENVTISQITKTVGVAKGTFYIHFASKESIMIEQFHKIDDYYMHWYNSVNKNQAATDLLTDFIRNVAKLTVDILKVDVIKVVYKSHINAPSNMKFLIDESRIYYKIINEIIVLGQNNNEFRPDFDSRKLTIMTTRYMRSILYDWAISDGSFDFLTEIEEQTPVFIQSIKKLT